LLLYSGFGRSKGVNTMNIKRDAPVLKAYTGADENNFLRGAGVTLQLNDLLELTAFASSRTRDANLLQSDTLDQEEITQQFSSFQSSGFHRTQAELEDEKSLRQNTVGARLAFAKSNFKVALNGLFDRFDKSLDRSIVPYNQFFFRGQQIANASIDYSYLFRNFNFFGETATSSNGRVATTNGLLMTLDRNVDFSILYRHFPKDYNALNANPLGETTGGRNETGLYFGTIVRFNQHWRFNAYFDTWRHPWLRFGVDAPSIGHEYRARVTYYLKRKLTAFAELRMEVKEHNAPDPEARFDYLVKRKLLQSRIQVNAQLNKTIELRSRVDAGFYDNGFNSERETGFAVYQDIIYKPTDFPLSFTSRFALFDTDSFNMRFYAYENDLLYSFSIPAYFGRGYRFYLNLRYRGIRNLSLELRYARTKFTDREDIGSGVNEILGSVRTDIKAQVSYRF